MTGRTLSLRAFALVFGLACAIFAVIAGYRGLLAYTNPMLAPIVMASLCAFAAVSFAVMAQVRAARKSARMTAIMSNLIDHKPLAGLAAALVAGAAARFGVEPDDLFPIFEAFSKPAQDVTPDVSPEATPEPVVPTESPLPSQTSSTNHQQSSPQHVH